MSASERTRGDVKDTGTLRARLAASRGKELAVPVHFYVDPSGNEYLIVGQMLTHHLPGQTSDSERAR